jgi:hypothetical protein
MLAIVAMTACMIFFAVVMQSRPGDRPPTLVVRDNAFVAPRRRIIVIAAYAQCTAVTIVMANSVYRDSRSHGHLASWLAVAYAAFIVILFTAMIAVYVVAVWRPALSITRAGVRLMFRVRSWDDLAARRPTYGYAQHWQMLPRFRAMAADPAFAGASVDYYLSAPEARAGIGTPDGYAQLRHALGVPPVPRPARPAPPDSDAGRSANAASTGD